MKKLLSLLLALTMALALCACGSTPAPAPAGSSGAASSGGSAAASSAASSSGEDTLTPTLLQCGDHITNDLFDMSLDSVELVMQLEEALDMEIELDQKVETVGNLVELVEARMKG